MTDVAYSKTAKGRAELEAHKGKLDASLRTLLNLVGERSSFAQMKARLARIPEPQLRAAFDKLLKEGYIESADDDLDFTAMLEKPAPKPSAAEVKEAESRTMAGMPSLRKAGYYVNILSRPGRRAPPRGGSKYTVLVLDGDQRNALLLGRTLMGAGFEIRGAASKEDILGQLRKAPEPDVIVMDTVLPDMEGLDLLARLHSHERFAKVPVIVMTEKMEQESVVAALSRGASGYMTKPFKPEALLESVKGVLGLA
jgi:CheY-like chemotaxis protein